LSGNLRLAKLSNDHGNNSSCFTARQDGLKVMRLGNNQ